MRFLLLDLDSHLTVSFNSSHFFSGVVLDVVNTKVDLLQLHLLSLSLKENVTN